MSKNFESTLQEHETLNKLITEKDLNTFTKFPTKNNFSSEFIDWLSPKYQEAFLEIYNTHLGTKKEAKVVKLINSTWFCNAETTENIVEFLLPRLEATNVLSQELAKKIDGNKDLEVILKVSGALVNNVLTYVNKAIFEKDHPKIQEKKNEIVDNCLAVCDELKRYKASSEIEFSMFNGILDRMRSIKMNETQQLKYNSFLKKSQSSSNKYVIITVIIVIIALIRLIAGFAN
ncbi:hypothetical protein [Winogradskyella algicola]|uniref:hypothetical protein n=1 Tax=Winogradskyella algicola TaxID=2575815 RepID=UPI0011095F62|nr:hypothetical protein [Winogradskyella algicola]